MKRNFLGTVTGAFCILAVFTNFPLKGSEVSQEASPSLNIFNELRVGWMRHDIGSGLSHRVEDGEDINAEVLFQGFDNDSENAFVKFILTPRPHLGATVNTKGNTHQFYLGLTWRFDFLDQLFIEPTFGGEVHTGKTHRVSPTSKRIDLGSRALFRESISLGWQFHENHSISAILDHASNASLAHANPGITNIGVRYGFKF